MRELEGKIAVITGGASGIGYATARAFIEAGAAVVVADLNEDRANGAANDLGKSAFPIAADVTSSADVNRIIETAVAQFGGIDILVNSAGIATKYRFVELPEDAWDAMMAVHTRGTFLCTQAAARVMIERGSGAVVNLSSIAAELGNPLAVHYAAAKGAIRMITRATAVSLAPHGIRVNAVGPGTTETPLTEVALRDPGIRAAAVERIPMGHFAQAEDVADIILFLASDRARYVTGQTIYVDGGWTAQLYTSAYVEIQEQRLPHVKGV